MARPKTTGRFATRSQLVERVRMLMKNGGMSDSAIAKSVGVSPMTVYWIMRSNEQIDDVTDSSMLEAKETSMKDRELTEAEMEAIERMTENAKQVLWTCGHGYSPDEHPVHLPRRVLDDVVHRHDLNVEFERRTPNLPPKWLRS